MKYFIRKTKHTTASAKIYFSTWKVAICVKLSLTNVITVLDQSVTSNDTYPLPTSSQLFVVGTTRSPSSAPIRKHGKIRVDMAISQDGPQQVLKLKLKILI